MRRSCKPITLRAQLHAFMVSPFLLSPGTGLTSVPSQFTSRNVTSFGKRVFADVIR